MLSQEIVKKIRQIEITTRRLLSGAFVGDYSSARKGAGFEFDQIRDYQLGDDVRFIDWNASARSGKLLVKEYIEERNRSVILAVDISASTFFSSFYQKKRDIMSQVAAVLALVADYGKDQASLLLFSDEVEVFIPPAKGAMHIHKIMGKLFSYEPRNKKTNINNVLDRLAYMRRRDAIVFLVSDFIDTVSEKKIYPVAKMYDLVAVRCLDKNEMVLPHVGFVNVQDLETGGRVLLDTRKGSGQINKFLDYRIMQQNNLLRKYGIDCLDVALDKPFIGDVITFFRRRMMY